MTESESIKFTVSNTQEEDKTKKKYKRSDNPNLKDVINFIKTRDLFPGEIEKLINLANKVPQGALKDFAENYKKYLRRK